MFKKEAQKIAEIAMDYEVNGFIIPNSAIRIKKQCEEELKKKSKPLPKSPYLSTVEYIMAMLKLL